MRDFSDLYLVIHLLWYSHETKFYDIVMLQLKPVLLTIPIPVLRNK